MGYRDITPQLKRKYAADIEMVRAAFTLTKDKKSGKAIHMIRLTFSKKIADQLNVTKGDYIKIYGNDTNIRKIKVFKSTDETGIKLIAKHETSPSFIAQFTWKVYTPTKTERTSHIVPHNIEYSAEEKCTELFIFLPPIKDEEERNNKFTELGGKDSKAVNPYHISNQIYEHET